MLVVEFPRRWFSPGVDVLLLSGSHRLCRHHHLQVGRDGSLQLRPGLVQGAQAGLGIGWKDDMTKLELEHTQLVELSMDDSMKLIPYHINLDFESLD